MALLAMSASLTPAANAFGTLCLSTPQLSLVAGVSTVSAVYDHPFWEQCQAHLFFANPAFPSVTFNFNPGSCFDRQLARFLVPAGAPNGDAYLIWDCDGLSPTCIQAQITQGRADEGLEAWQNGSIICMPSNAWNQTARATCAQSASTASEAPTPDSTLPSTVTGLGQGPNASVSASSDPPSQFSTNMSSPTGFSLQPNLASSDLRTDASGTWATTSSTSLNTDTQISTKASDKLGASTENSIMGFPGLYGTDANTNCDNITHDDGPKLSA